MITRIFLIICALCVSETNNMAAQSTAKKSTQAKSANAELEFVYNGKPISPEALIPFFPSLTDSVSQTVVNLDRALLYHAYSDTIWNKKLKWLKPDQIKRSFSCATDEGTFVTYIVLGKVAVDRFVVLSCMNMRGSLQTYTFVVDLRDNKLVKTGGLKTDNITDYPVSMTDNKLIWHDASYMIPASE